MTSARILPRVWSAKQLERARTAAIQVFVGRRLKEGDPDYLKQFSESESMITELLEKTSNLMTLRPEAFVDRIDLLRDIARFTLGPPVSRDDLATLMGSRIVTLAEISRALKLIGGLIDRSRFPWVVAKVAPTSIELRVATVATASIRAVEKARTSRRGAEQARQEGYVASTLARTFKEIGPSVRDPDNEIPAGSFKRGVNFESKQCDLLVRLFDNRFLAIECKSSNSAVNSIKRLNDVFEKAEVWRRERGKKVVTAAVVAGVFSLRTLENAQSKGVYLFWENDLAALAEFVEKTKRA